MPDLTAWIEAQLKRGHTKEEVKNYLAKLGYPASAITEVDKMAPSTTTPTITGRQAKALLTIATIGAIGLLLLWLADSLRPTQQPEAPAPTASVQKPAPPATLCEEFKEAAHAVRCGKAVAIALADSPGTLQKVSIGNMEAPLPPRFSGQDFWLIDIQLENPYKLPSGKEATLLRIGIPLEKEEGIFRESKDIK